MVDTNLKGLYELTEEVLKDLSYNKVPISIESLINTVERSVDSSCYVSVDGVEHLRQIAVYRNERKAYEIKLCRAFDNQYYIYSVICSSECSFDNSDEHTEEIRTSQKKDMQHRAMKGHKQFLQYLKSMAEHKVTMDMDYIRNKFENKIHKTYDYNSYITIQVYERIDGMEEYLYDVDFIPEDNNQYRIECISCRYIKYNKMFKYEE